jgi:predicted GNAT superfamily acetyltransferase
VVYDAVEARATGTTGRLALEVNAVPPNGPSLAFHRARGFREVGLRHEPGGKQVAMMVKELQAPPPAE